MFVDDETGLAESGCELLTNLGYEVTPETDSLKALEGFKAAPDRFDMIITDLTMPNMTGIELAQEIKMIRPAIPIILCTGFAGKITVPDALEKGFAELLLKPVDARELAHIIRKILDKVRENKIY